ncbi:MAG: M15 family metallopeptidase [Eubacterium sp.]|nr:M15 family metallopeptidase [Eubacterium sp.]
MKKKYRKTTGAAWLSLIIILSLSLLCACGRKEKSEADASSASAASSGTDAVSSTDSSNLAADSGSPASDSSNLTADSGSPASDSSNLSADSASPVSAEEPAENASQQTGNSLSATAAEPEDDDLVRVRDYIPDILVELKYATEDNFTGQIIYDFQDAYLRYGTVKRLQYVQDVMKEQGLTLKIWDAFRPLWAQQALWDAYPDPTYVSNPEERGYTSHNFGNTVDITVVREDGSEIPLPTGFDDFSLKADRDYDDCTEEEAENAWMLDQTMSDAGFEGYWGEWWHYQDIDEYPGEDLEGAELK